MITEDRVTFEIAKLLRDKGFPQNTFEIDCNVCYKYNGNLCNNARSMSGVDREISYMAPTLQMAMKWLREEKEIYITIVYGDYPSLNKVFWTPQIDSLEGFDLPDSFYKEYKKYEEACEAAIKYALENLI